MQQGSGAKWVMRITAVVAAIVFGPPLIAVIVFAVGSMIFPH